MIARIIHSPRWQLKHHFHWLCSHFSPFPSIDISLSNDFSLSVNSVVVFSTEFSTFLLNSATRWTRLVPLFFRFTPETPSRPLGPLESRKVSASYSQLSSFTKLLQLLFLPTPFPSFCFSFAFICTLCPPCPTHQGSFPFCPTLLRGCRSSRIFLKLLTYSTLLNPSLPSNLSFPDCNLSVWSYCMLQFPTTKRWC